MILSHVHQHRHQTGLPECSPSPINEVLLIYGNMNALDLDVLGIQTFFHISLILGHLYSLRTFGGKSKQSEHVSYGAPPVHNF